MRLVVSLVLALLAAPAVAQGAGPLAPPSDDPSPYSDARLVADVAQIAPGEAFDVALEVDVEEGWHIYWKNPGDSGQALTVDWSLSDGAEAGPLRFPPPAVYVTAGLATYAHSGTPSFLTRITAPDDASGTLDLTAEARWLICADVCLPARATVALSVPVGPTTERTDALDAARAALPDDGAGWVASAALDGGDYLLTIDPPDGVALDGATFFVEDAGVLDHSAEQAFAQEGGAWAVRLAGSPFASAPTETLRGVLVADGVAVELSASVSGATASTASAAAPSMTLWTALGFAFLGGILLNLMPCVFPILSIKILGFVDGRERSPAALRAHGLAFAAGVVLSFLALAGALLALKTVGDGAGWGFQLSYPPVVAGLAALMVLLALNLFGVFEMGQRLASAGGALDTKNGLGGAFLSGVLAVVVASPCTAPFMAGALGFALVQPAGVALAVFTALGVGMALPYVALSFRPGWIQKLPRPGPWMETLKQVLAFPLLATAVWLVWLYGRVRDPDAAALLLLALVTLGLAVWAWGRWSRPGVSGGARWGGRSFAAVALVGAVALSGASLVDRTETWVDFDADVVDTLVASGEPVFVDVTAAWCLSCQVNKQTSLTAASVEAAFAEGGVATFRADWTNQDPEITAYLAKYGRSGVPLNVFYPGGDAEPVILPPLLTPGLVLDALSASDPPQTAAR